MEEPRIKKVKTLTEKNVTIIIRMAAKAWYGDRRI
jgi:hypothetical protein